MAEDKDAELLTTAPTVGRIASWAQSAPKTALASMIAGAAIIAVFGAGGLLGMYKGTAGFMGTPMTPPPLWAVLAVGAGFAGSSAAFVLWHWTRPRAFALVATGFQVLWTVTLQIHESVLGIGAWVFLWLALYYVGQRLTTAEAWLTLFGNLAVHAAILAVFQPYQWQGLLILAAGLNIAAGAFAVWRGTHRRYIDALLDRNRLLAAQRDQRAELAVAAERSRIAREMHDIVSHSLAVMVTLSDGAARLAATDAEAAAEAMTQVSETGRHAVGDMRRLIGFLRSEADLSPQPSLTDLGDLVAKYQQSGLPVTVNLATALPDDAAFGLTVYRIVQEALTNVLRHAPASPEVTVEITQSSPGVYEIVVENAPGDSPIQGAGAGAGQGLVGMRQRAEVWHGSVEAGPRYDGGWRVHVTLCTDDVD